MYDIPSISNDENPGVSAIKLLLANSKSSTCFVVCFPFFSFSEVSPSTATSSLKILFVRADLPTPEFPLKAVILLFIILAILSIPIPFLAVVVIT